MSRTATTMSERADQAESAGEKASDVFVRCLEAEGVTQIFGVPGEENADLMISLLSSSIGFVLCRHEQAAAFMADAYGRLTGKAGVCLATLGPGATNLMTGIADANMDRSPVVAIIGQTSTRRLHKESHQNMDAIGMFRPITKWAQPILTADATVEIVRKAFKVAQTEKPGATVVELPEDIAKQRTTVATPLPIYKARRPGADHKSVARAIDAIASAERPLIIAGNGVLRKKAAEQLREFAHKLGIGVVMTFMGKGAVAMDDPHCLFTLGLQGRDHIIAALEDSDTIISVGYDLVEYAPSLWNKGDAKTIVHIDFVTSEVDSAYPMSVGIVADIADSLWHLNQELDRRFAGKLPLFDIHSRAALRETVLSDLRAEEADNAFPAKPQRLVWDIRKALGPDDILLSDVGAHKMWIARYYQCFSPNTCLISNGFCSMGFALPGAIGAKFAFPERKVVAVCGDGGFLMNVQELETAVRNKISFVCVVWIDGEYGLIKWKQQNEFNGRHTNLAFGNPDFDALAKAFGMWGRTIGSVDEFAPALDEALELEGPSLIAVPVDYLENRRLTERLGNLVCTI